MGRAFPVWAGEGVHSQEALRALPSASLRPVRTRPPYPGSLLSAPKGAEGIGRAPISRRLMVLRAAFASLPNQTRSSARRGCSSGRLFRQGCHSRRHAAQCSHTRARITSASLRRGRCIGAPLAPIRPRPIGSTPAPGWRIPLRRMPAFFSPPVGRRSPGMAEWPVRCRCRHRCDPRAAAGRPRGSSVGEPAPSTALVRTRAQPASHSAQAPAPPTYTTDRSQVPFCIGPSLYSRMPRNT